jgi:hypothetical protein
MIIIPFFSVILNTLFFNAFLLFITTKVFSIALGIYIFNVIILRSREIGFVGL